MKLSELKRIQSSLPASFDPSDPELHSKIMQHIGIEPGTLYQELEMESRFVDTHQDVSYSNTYVVLHSHSFYEILFCRNSCDVEYLVGAERYRIRKGDIILVPPGVSHCPLLPETMNEPYKRDVIWLSPEFMEIMIQSFPLIRDNRPQYTTLLRTGGTKWEFIGELFSNGIRESERKAPGWEAAVIGNTIFLFSQVYRAFLERTAAPLTAETPELLDQVLAYLEAHLTEKLTLGDVAKQFYVSESTISQTFRKKMGVSFHRYVTQRRLIAAKALISEGIQLETVGHQVGFADYSSFYRAFKQEYGISPRHYRKLLENVEPIL